MCPAFFAPKIFTDFFVWFPFFFPCFFFLKAMKKYFWSSFFLFESYGPFYLFFSIVFLLFYVIYHDCFTL